MMAPNERDASDPIAAVARQVLQYDRYVRNGYLYWVVVGGVRNGCQFNYTSSSVLHYQLLLHCLLNNGFSSFTWPAYDACIRHGDHDHEPSAILRFSKSSKCQAETDLLLDRLMLLYHGHTLLVIW